MSAMTALETCKSAAHRPKCPTGQLAIAGGHRRANMQPMKHRAQGMTLLELMLGLTVLGILMAIAVPSFRTYTGNARTTAATNDLVTAMAVARSEALRRSSLVRVCASADLADCSGTNDWSTGWIVFADPDADGSVDANELIQTWPPLTGGVVMTADAAAVTYNAMGMGQIAATAVFTLTPPHCVGNRVNRTEVALAGTVQSSHEACP
jgi:type IV fimbrial biogenesis protein FimT